VTALLGLIAGCGGSGSPSSSNLALFITDNLRDDYDAVWVTIYEARLGGNGPNEVVFSDPDGVTVNLISLNDGDSRYLFLGAEAIAVGRYTSVQVLTSKDLTLFEEGSDTGIEATFAEGLDAGENKSLLRLNLTPNLEVPTVDGKLVVDFDLTQWTINGTVVSPVLTRHDGHRFHEDDRHEHHEFRGVITRLDGEAPNQKFGLALRESDRVLPVHTTEHTEIYREDGDSPRLENGMRVTVRGRFRTDTHSLWARAIKIHGEDDHAAKIRGRVHSVNEDLSIINVVARETSGFRPPTDVIRVKGGEETRWILHTGEAVRRATFFAWLRELGDHAAVEAAGVWNGHEQIFLARVVKLIRPDEDRHDVAVGRVAEFNKEERRLVMILHEWRGFHAKEGMRLTVQANDETTYTSASEETHTAHIAWGDEMAEGVVLRVDGQMHERVMLARRIKFLERD
jgi:hypothetical protein